MREGNRLSASSGLTAKVTHRREKGVDLGVEVGIEIFVGAEVEELLLGKGRRVMHRRVAADARHDVGVPRLGWVMATTTVAEPIAIIKFERAADLRQVCGTSSARVSQKG